MSLPKCTPIMKAIVFAIGALLLVNAPVHSQASKAEKQLIKAQKLTNKGKLDKAETKLMSLLADYPRYGQAWDQLASVRYLQYQNRKGMGLSGGAFTVTTTDDDGNEVANDSLAMAFMALLNSVDLSQSYYDEYKNTLRLATLRSTTAYSSAILLRLEFVDPQLDTAINDTAWEHFGEAEYAFRSGDYGKAADLYQKALDVEPDFFKAMLYQGDAYYFQGFYLEAIKKFKAAIERYPNLLEPRKYLLDAYGQEGLFDKAVETGIESMLVYPDLTMRAKLEQVASMNGQQLDIGTTLRSTFPNKIEEEKSISMISYNDPKAEGPWVHYEAALEMIREYCDEDGMITQKTELTESPYLEVYSWEHMLANSQDPTLEEARKMQELGFLDCYVMISCYHFDFYDQYQHFASANQERIREYFDRFLINK